MNYQQPLFKITEGNKADVVYTVDPVAKDIVSFFKPSGKVLEPCRGNGAFMKHLPPETEYCEIEAGKDFFAYSDKVDWIVSNPPYSGFFDWIYHSMTIAQHIVYLLPANKPFISNRLIMLLKEWGEIAHMRFYGTGNKIGFNVGFAIAAFYFKKGNQGGCSFSYWENA